MEPDLTVLDPTSALASVGGDADFLVEIAGLVRAAWPTLLSDLRKDLAAANFGALEADARLTRVAAEYVAAKGAYLAALQLQVMAVHRDLDGARRATENLEGEVGKLPGTEGSSNSMPPLTTACALSLHVTPGGQSWFSCPRHDRTRSSNGRASASCSLCHQESRHVQVRESKQDRSSV